MSEKKNIAGHYIPCFHLIRDPINVQQSCYLFWFLSCISLSTDETYDESHTLLFKMYLCTSEHPYLITIAFHIAEGWCCPFSNPSYAISFLPVEPFSSASSENVYKTIIRMSMGWVCVVLWYLVSDRTFGVMNDHTFSKVANHQIRHQATHKVGCQPGDCLWPV